VKSSWKHCALGVLLAIAITTTMDATGLAAFSALALFPLIALFWYLQGLSRMEVGLVLGQLRHYGLAVICPLSVLGVAALLPAMTGASHLSLVDWNKGLFRMAVIGGSTVVGVIITEEGFFRGWLWGALHRTGLGNGLVLVWTSIAFSLWHLSVAVLDTEFIPPLAQVPIYLANAAILGATWGMLRSISGSVLVSSVSHGLWNGIDYGFFGIGNHVGVFGIANTALYDPEVGVVGLGLNLLLAAVLCRWWFAQKAPESAKPLQAPNLEKA
jgi:membrane protease YdiL (CAAX protease family)